MKYIKMLALAAVTAIAVPALAATASATTITSEGSAYTGSIHAVNEGGVVLHGPIDITCNNSTVAGSVEQHGSSTTASGKISTWVFNECNSGNDVEVQKAGEVIVHTQGESSNGNGTVTVSGSEVKVRVTSLAIDCVYGTENTDLGTLTGSATTGSTATLDADTSAVPRTGGSIFCGSSGELTAAYNVTTPANLNVD